VMILCVMCIVCVCYWLIGGVLFLPWREHVICYIDIVVVTVTLLLLVLCVCVCVFCGMCVCGACVFRDDE
jgi:hypothetical protein